jgi:hypothetical protein
MRFPLHLAAAALVACAVVSVAGAASNAVAPLTTPKAMAAKIRGAVPQIPTSTADQPSTISASTCHGLGAAREGEFTLFRCKAHWDRGTATVWARALPGKKFCASASGMAACPKPPAAAGDPRICSNPQTSPTADPNLCARNQSELAVVRAMRAWFVNSDWQIGNVVCAGKNVRWKCTFLQFNVYGIYYNAKIHFVLAHGAWSATIAVKGDGDSSTCTVLPKPGNRAGKPSNWAAGPTSTCTG